MELRHPRSDLPLGGFVHALAKDHRGEDVSDVLGGGARESGREEARDVERSPAAAAAAVLVAAAPPPSTRAAVPEACIHMAFPVTAVRRRIRRVVLSRDIR